MQRKTVKLQAAIDFLSTYGLALAVMLVAFVTIYRISLSPNQPAIFCSSVPGFSCNFISVNSMGVVTAKFSQALGTQITINGVACSDQQSPTTDTPAYGNLFVTNSVNYYPIPSYPPGNIIYSGGYYVVQAYCYNSGGQVISTTGHSFTGYVWLNYSIPNYGMQTQKIATFTSIYS